MQLLGGLPRYCSSAKYHIFLRCSLRGGSSLCRRQKQTESCVTDLPSTTRRHLLSATLAGVPTTGVLAAEHARTLAGSSADSSNSAIQVSGESHENLSSALRMALQESSVSGRPVEINTPLKLNSPITVPGNISIRGTGTIDMSAGGAIKVGSGVTRISDLARDIGLFDTVLEFSSPHNLSINDVVAVWNPREFSQAPFRFYYRAGDMFCIAEILSATSVRIFGIAQEPYRKGEVRVYRLNAGSFRMSGVKLVPPNIGFPLFLDGLVDVVLDGVRVEPGADYAAIEVHRCFNVGIYDPEITIFGGDAYPITLSNSQKITVVAARGMYSKRHCLGLGGRDGEATIATGDILILGMSGDNIASNGLGAADIHGDCKRITYDSCQLSMANMAGENVTYRNCRITGAPPGHFRSGFVISGSEVVGGLYTIENCHLISAGDGVREGSHLNLVLSRRTKDFRLVMRNVTLENVGPNPAGATLIALEVGNDTPSRHLIDIQIDGLTYIGSAPPLAVIGIRNGNDVSRQTRIRMQNVSGVERLYAASVAVNYNIDFEGPATRAGVTYRQDESVTLNRMCTRYQLFNADLTADRTVKLPAREVSAMGDEFSIGRADGTDYTVMVEGLTAIRAYEWVKVVFRGLSSAGEWVVVERGSTRAIRETRA